MRRLKSSFGVGVALLVGLLVAWPAQAPSAAPLVALDADLDVGYQGATVVEEVAAGGSLSLEVFGKGLDKTTGFKAVISYDAAEVSLEGFRVTDLIPGITGLQVEKGSGVVEIGGISLAGASSVAKGRLGVVTFKAASGFAGKTEIAISSGSLVSAEGETAFETASTVTLGGTLPSILALDASMKAGYQGSATVDEVEAGDEISVEILGKDLVGAVGFSATVTFDPAKVTLVGFTVTDLIPGLTGLRTEKGAGTVDVGGVTLIGGTTATKGRLGVLKFVAGPGFTGGTEITVTKGTLALAAGPSAVDVTSTITLGDGAAPSAATPDFTGDGKVDFSDFVLFAQAFGLGVGDATYDAKFDLDGSDKVDFGDFVAFAQSFGKPVSSGKPALTSGANAGALVRVESVPNGGEVYADVGISGVTRLQGYEMVVRYDPAALRFVEARRPDGSPLSLAGSTPLFLAHEIAAGTVVLADAIVDGGRASGSGPVAEVVFQQVDGRGNAPFEVEVARLFDGAGGVDLVGATGGALPTGYTLAQNVPNPFNPATQIAYQVPERAEVRLSVYTATGQRVAELVRAVQEPGTYRVTWDGRDGAGRAVASGVYFYRMETETVQLVRKMLLLQ